MILSSNALRELAPAQRHLWIRVVVAIFAVGYGLATLVVIRRHGFELAVQNTEFWTFMMALATMTLERRGRVELAGQLALGTAWLELHSAFLLSEVGVRNSASLVLPLLVLAVSLMFGFRHAIVMAVASVVAVPLLAQAGGVFFSGPGLPESDYLYITVMAVSVLGTASLLYFFMRSLTWGLEHAKASSQRALELTEQLQHAQKLESLGLLAGGIAHDFNNLLTAVGGYGALLEDSEDPEARDASEQLVALQQRGSALTRQLLSFARQDVTQPKPVELPPIIDGVERLLERIVGEQIVLDTDIQECGTIMADPGQIEQVIINLAANARDAMPDGGTLHIGCAISSEGNEAVLLVGDTGMGMDAETAARIFEPFFTTKPRGRGTGLGLSTVHGIITSSGGRIEVESTPGEGTAFKITWPNIQPEISEDPPRAAMATSSELRDRGTILVVEDDDQIRAFVRRQLRRSGYDVHTAPSGAEAVALVRSENVKPDLLLTDMVMPGMTGVQVAERLAPALPEMPVLYMSGYLDEELTDVPFDPVEDLILKPFSTADLLRRVECKISQRPRSSERPRPSH